MSNTDHLFRQRTKKTLNASESLPSLPENHYIERLKTIQSKLEAIDFKKQQVDKQRINEGISQKLIQVQKRVNEETKSLQEKTKILRQELMDLKTKENEFCKKNRISTTHRKMSISQLRQQWERFMLQEEQGRKNIQALLGDQSSKSTQILARDIKFLEKQRISFVNSFQNQLQQKIPKLQSQIRQGAQRAESKLQSIHQKICAQMIESKQNIAIDIKAKEKANTQISEQVKKSELKLRQEIDAERNNRNLTKDRLFLLLNKAVSKLKK